MYVYLHMKRMTQANCGPHLSEAVVEAVADAKDVDSTELEPPLTTVVDADALDNLFVSETDGCVVFEYSGCEVVVESNRTVEARKRTDTEQRTNYRTVL
jgi:hypothetical protein